MAKRQTRRAISVKGLTYQRLKKHCDAKGISVAGFVEELVAEKLDALEVPEETVLEPRPRSPKSKAVENFQGSSFSF